MDLWRQGCSLAPGEDSGSAIVPADPRADKAHEHQMIMRLAIIVISPLLDNSLSEQWEQYEVDNGFGLDLHEKGWEGEGEGKKRRG